jgi:hypothetical protein
MPVNLRSESDLQPCKQQCPALSPRRSLHQPQAVDNGSPARATLTALPTLPAPWPIQHSNTAPKIGIQVRYGSLISTTLNCQPQLPSITELPCPCPRLAPPPPHQGRRSAHAFATSPSSYRPAPTAYYSSWLPPSHPLPHHTPAPGERHSVLSPRGSNINTPKLGAAPQQLPSSAPQQLPWRSSATASMARNGA